jgi:hypothetical protein
MAPSAAVDLDVLIPMAPTAFVDLNNLQLAASSPVLTEATTDHKDANLEFSGSLIPISIPTEPVLKPSPELNPDNPIHEQNIVPLAITAPAIVSPLQGHEFDRDTSMEFVWSVPAAVLANAVGFNILISNSSSDSLGYQNSAISTNNCTPQGLCVFAMARLEAASIGDNHLFRVSTISANGESEFGSVEFGFLPDTNSDPEPAADIVVDSPDLEIPESNESVENEVPVPSEDFIAILADVDQALESKDTWYSFAPQAMDSQHGYHSKPAMNGLAQTYRVTGDTKYIDAAIQIGNKWIDSGRQLDSDGYLDWQYTDSSSYFINKEHHEWRAAAGIADVLIEIKRTGYEGIEGTEAKFLNFLQVEVWEKWSPPNAPANRSNIYTYGLDFVGRLALTAMALDQYDATPGDNQWSDYLISSTGRFGVFFNTMQDLEQQYGSAYFPTWTNGEPHPSGQTVYDTSHAGDMMYSVARAKQLGYDPQGSMESTLAVIERTIGTRMFKTSEGFSHWSDGEGDVNASNWSSAHGHSLTAGLSETLLNRWVEFYRYNNPYMNAQEERLIWMAGGLLWALDGGEI